ncbi:hypothetical protein [Clostridium aminobutyricum]|uniref:Uncharacterized protein n=1 Tax=Clostridium aminobutyricum TaxID=33953 RepID=A0A939D979_CLOAM|nr:hypothetical protein [Clostridium aminobutyricum]MBN7773392.1 hypothetical protein [Clostridium aminobutyricum]
MKNYIVSIAAFLCILSVFLYAVSGLSQRSVIEGAVTLENAIKRASVQCYAIEGRYPSSVEYLVKNYGLQIDEKKYAVFYEGFASNIMPDITVSVR